MKEAMKAAEKHVREHIKTLPLTTRVGVTQAEIDEATKLCATFAQEQIAKRDEAWLAAIEKHQYWIEPAGDEPDAIAVLDAVKQEMGHE